MFQTAFCMFFPYGFIKYKKAYLSRYAFFQSDSKLEFRARLVCHKVYSCFHFIIAQAAITAFCWHRIKAFDSMFVQSVFTLFDARSPVFFFTYDRSAWNQTAMTCFTAGFKNSFTINFGRSLFRFSFSCWSCFGI